MPGMEEEETILNVLKLFSEILIGEAAVWARKISQAEKRAGREPTKQTETSLGCDRCGRRPFTLKTKRPA